MRQPQLQHRIIMVLRADHSVQKVTIETKYGHHAEWSKRKVPNVWLDFQDWPPSVLQFILEQVEKQSRLDL